MASFPASRSNRRRSVSHPSFGRVLAALLWLAAGGVAAGPGAEPVATPGAASQPPPRAGKHPPTVKIYKYFSGGTASFSDRPPGSQAYVVLRYACYACSLQSTVDWHSTRLHSDKFVDEIDAAARRFHIDPALVRAVIHAESGFNAQARSPKGAVGLMQLMPQTARALGVANARLPRENIRGGVQYLAALLARFKNNIALATAAYNAGPEAVEKYAGVPPYPETQVYVQRVGILHRRYRRASRS